MNKFYLLVLAFLSFSFHAISQQVPRNQVVIEVATGTWCQYCPGAAMGVEELIANGYNVAVIEYHGGDDYATTASDYRNNFYNATGFPTAHFDGLLPVVGGSQTQSMYSSYLPKVNQRNNVLSSFTLNLTGTATARSYDINITANKVAITPNPSLRLHLVLTESNIEEAWQGLTELNFVERLMIPDHLGTQVNFASQSTVTTALEFDVPDEWEITNCELVAFLQDNSTKEILQAIKVPLTDIQPTLNYDIALANLSNIPQSVSMGRLSPQIILRNDGATELTSAIITYNVNGSTPITYNWTGSIPYLSKDTLVLPEITFTPENQNSIQVSVSNPNGQVDQYAGNNEKSQSFGMVSSYFQAPITLVLRTDERPQETTWKVLNENGEIIKSGGPYTEPNKVNIVPLTIPDNGAYRFVISDLGGNGICCKHGTGLYKIADKTSQTIYTGNSFLLEETVDFLVSGVTGITMASNSTLNVYPNPASSFVNIEFPNGFKHGEQVYLYDISGRMVYSSSQLTEGVLTIPLTHLSKGIYKLTFSNQTQTYNQKIIVN
jgi:hypothetical protein